MGAPTARTSRYGDSIAEVYDELHSGPRFRPDDTVAFLAELAQGGPVLEIGVGTGRIALALARVGLEVHGVDVSAAMLDLLRRKDVDAVVTTWHADFLEFDEATRYPLVACLFNTLLEFLSAAQQVDCLCNAARHLTPSGRLVVECFTPLPYNRNERISVRQVEPERLHVGLGRFDPVTRIGSGHHAVLSNEGLRLYPYERRELLHTEIDLMARLAGLVLEDRFGDWRKGPFHARGHVSVYRLAEANAPPFAGLRDG